MHSDEVALGRVDARAGDKDTLDNVLVIFVARHPERGGQYVVGWYGNADLYRTGVRNSPGKPRGFGYRCAAKQSDCVLLPANRRVQEVRSGKGGMGQANVCYPLDTKGRPKDVQWIPDALEFVKNYQGSNLLLDPAADAEQEATAAVESAVARSHGQGFARTAKERKAIEDYSMASAKKYFKKQGWFVEDVSARRSYDLLCTKPSKEQHVEVKGTTTTGQTIILTRSEVEHARDSRNSCTIFILHNIKLMKGKASGGKMIIISPWRPKTDHLTPVCFVYSVQE